MSYNDNTNNDENSLISDSTVGQYIPIQKNTKLFKYILYTTKIEVKFNSLVKFVYTISLLEIIMWIVGFFIFCSSPSDLYLIWVLIVHIVKGGLGLYLLNKMPKTYEIMENVAKNPDFDENKITDQINEQIKEIFITRFSEKKCYFYAYLLSNIICLVIDFVILLVQVIVFGDDDWILMQTCMLFIMVIYIISDVIYFLWYFTLQFSLPDEIIEPIREALFGSITKLNEFINKKIDNNNQNL